MGTPSRETILAQLRILVTGLAKYPAPHPIVVSQQEYDNADVAKRIQVSIDAEVAVNRKTAELRAVVMKCNATREREADFLDTVKKLVISRHKNNPVALVQHGLSLPKPNPKRSAQQKLLMQAKNQATRKKRGTLSRKKRKAIKGNVEGVTVTPIVREEDED